MSPLAWWWRLIGVQHVGKGENHVTTLKLYLQSFFLGGAERCDVWEGLSALSPPVKKKMACCRPISVDAMVMTVPSTVPRDG